MSGDRLLPEWEALLEAMPEGERVTARDMRERCQWWRRSPAQLAHALRGLARDGLIAHPARGQFVRREGTVVIDGRVHMPAIPPQRQKGGGADAV
jgi:hypothetical protein